MIKYPRAWEKVGLEIYRLRVPGGWVFLSIASESETESIVFIPHPKGTHEGVDDAWPLEDLDLTEK